MPACVQRMCSRAATETHGGVTRGSPVTTFAQRTAQCACYSGALPYEWTPVSAKEGEMTTAVSTIVGEQSAKHRTSLRQPFIQAALANNTTPVILDSAWSYSIPQSCSLTMSTKNEFECHARKKRRKKPSVVRICLDSCKYDVLRQVARDLQWKIVTEDTEWDVLWSDCSVSSERVLRLITGQVRRTPRHCAKACQRTFTDTETHAEDQSFLRNA